MIRSLQLVIRNEISLIRRKNVGLPDDWGRTFFGAWMASMHDEWRAKYFYVNLWNSEWTWNMTYLSLCVNALESLFHSRFLSAWKYTTEVSWILKRDKRPVKIYRVPRVLRKICLKKSPPPFFTRKSLRPLLLLEKVSAPFFELKKIFAPPFFLKKKSPLFNLFEKQPYASHENQSFMYLLSVSSYANEHTRVTWPYIDLQNGFFEK